MQQVKFYRVSSLPKEGSDQKGEIGSLYFLHDDLNNFNDLYVCIGDYEFESYSAHLYWSDDPEGGSGGGSWEGGETGESIDLSNYLLKTGGTMVGNLDFTNDSAIVFDGGQSAGIYPRQEALSIEVGSGSIMLNSQGCVFSTPIQASGFSIPNGTSDLILLADGTTTSFPTLPELNYLPLTGGTMSGNITMSGESKLIFGDTSVYNNGDLFIGGRVQVEDSLSVSNMVTASGFQHAANNSNDYVLLAGGGTKLLSEISSPDMSGYLPLTGGTLTGSFNVSSIFSVSTTAEETTPIVLGDTSNKSVKINYSASYDDEGELNIMNNPHLIIGPANSAALFLNRSGILSVDQKNSLGANLYLNPQGGVIKLGGGLETLSYINAASLSLSGGISCGASDMLKYGTTRILQYDASNSQVCIGENQVDLISETITLSANNVTAYNNITANGDINAAAFYETSDVRKKDIKSDLSLDKCYDLIDKCQTVIYSLKDQTKEQVGMIAQEIEEFFPEVVATDENGFKSLAYDRLVVICFKVLKDVIKRLEKLENV